MILLDIAGCSRCVVPRIGYRWPAMSGSRIEQRLAIAISSQVENFRLTSESDECVLLGKGVARAAGQAADAVFSKFSVVAPGRSPADLKTAGYMGLVNLVDLQAGIVERGETVELVVKLLVEAFDFRMSSTPSVFAIADSTFTVPGTGDHKAGHRVQKLAEVVLEKIAAQLAWQMLNLYGCRQ